MTQINHLNIHDEIKHQMHLRGTSGLSIAAVLRPICIDDFFHADPQLKAVSVEYIVEQGDGIGTPTLPITLWKEDCGRANILPLQDASRALLTALTDATASVVSSRHLRQIPKVVMDRGKPIMGTRSFAVLNVIYLPDVTFMMKADIGENFQDIDGENWSVDQDLAKIMEPVIGEAWYIPGDSHHAHISQMARLSAQAKIYDAIIREQTEVSLKTTLMPPSSNE